MLTVMLRSKIDRAGPLPSPPISLHSPPLHPYGLSPPLHLCSTHPRKSTRVRVALAYPSSPLFAAAQTAPLPASVTPAAPGPWGGGVRDGALVAQLHAWKGGQAEA
jgi:hypothetical protein